MNIYILQLLAVGLVILTVTLSSGWIRRLPFSYALIYLAVGIFLGPKGLNLFQFKIDSHLLERITEFVVIVSVFSCGLKMSPRLRLKDWNITARLIILMMPISIIALGFVAHQILGMSWGAAILLGAILAPTDPVLASDVQLSHMEDQNPLRFSLTSEGGLNDALAFPFVYFGIYALKNPNWNNWLIDWIGVDLVWAIAMGILMGIVVAKTVIWLERQFMRTKPIDELMEDFVALSLILLTYSLTELINGYGFLAVFVAGVTTQKNYYKKQQTEKTWSQLLFVERLEKLLEIGTIILLGSLLAMDEIIEYWKQALLIATFLFFLIRPISVLLSFIGSKVSLTKQILIGWFGIRGVGSLYYLSYAIGKDIDNQIGVQIAWITIITIVFSIIIYGITSTPLMGWYEQQRS